MDPAAAELLGRYGWLAVAVGSFLEGETVTLSAAALASRGLLDPTAVLLAAAAGSWASHAIFFGLARVFGGERVVRWFPRWEPGIRRMDRLFHARPWVTVVALQYMYGMRRIGAVAVGLSRFPAGFFLFGEAINCLVWAAIVGALGFLLGESASELGAGLFGAIWLALIGAVALVFLSRRIAGRVRSRAAVRS